MEYRFICNTCGGGKTGSQSAVQEAIENHKCKPQEKPPVQECECHCHAHIKKCVYTECEHCTPTDTKACICPRLMASVAGHLTKCPLSEPVSTTDDWDEKEFDKWFGHGKKGHLHGLLAESYYKEVKQYIRDQRERDRIQLRKNIGQLRQWLNEKPADHLVTDKDIEIWLGLEER